MIKTSNRKSEKELFLTDDKSLIKILTGDRCVGKTTLLMIDMFNKTEENSQSLVISYNPSIHMNMFINLFKDFDPKIIKLSPIKGIVIIGNKTFIFKSTDKLDYYIRGYRPKYFDSIIVDEKFISDSDIKNLLYCSKRVSLAMHVDIFVKELSNHKIAYNVYLI